MRKQQIVFDCQVDSITEMRSNENNINNLLCPITIVDKISDTHTQYKYIAGYQMATELIYDACMENDRPVTQKDHLSYPYLFMCRHTIELMIKKLLVKYGLSWDANHNLVKNWETLRGHINKTIRGTNVKIVLDNVTTYVLAWQMFDEKSTRNRYPIRNKKKTPYKAFSIDIVQLNELFLKYMKQMEILEREIDKK